LVVGLVGTWSRLGRKDGNAAVRELFHGVTHGMVGWPTTQTRSFVARVSLATTGPPPRISEWESDTV
jgi:hypothetical protein